MIFDLETFVRIYEKDPWWGFSFPLVLLLFFYYIFTLILLWQKPGGIIALLDEAW
jgi:hypothetical protein